MYKLIFFMLLPLVGMSQTDNTLEVSAFTYLKKGLVNDLKLGKDPSKKGYTFEQVNSRLHEQGFSKTNIYTYEVKKVACSCTVAYVMTYETSEAFVFPINQTDPQILEKYEGQLTGLAWDYKLYLSNLPAIMNK